MEVSLQQWCESLSSNNATWDGSANKCIVFGTVQLGNGVNSVTLNVAEAEELENRGTIQFQAPATLINRGLLSNSGGKIISNNQTSSLLENRGTLNNYGSMSIFRMNNSGTINVGGLSTIRLDAVIKNDGIINNSGAIFGSMFDSHITNPGTINNDGHIASLLENSGMVMNRSVIEGAIANATGGTVLNDAVITLHYISISASRNSINSGTITNASTGTIEIYDTTLSNSGLIDNLGMINNHNAQYAEGGEGVIINTHTINNTGVINNEGTIENACGGVITGEPIVGNAALDKCTADDTPPLITQQPADMTACVKPDESDRAVAEFHAAATGNPDPTIQWQSSFDGGATFTDLHDGTLPDLKIVGFWLEHEAYQYRAIFTNAAGTVTSNPATLTVYTWPSIISQPTDQTVYEGEQVTFVATADGVPLVRFQWYVSEDQGVHWQELPDVTSSTLSFTASLMQDGNQYGASLTGGTLADGMTCGFADTVVVTLHVNALDTTPPDTFMGSTPAAQSNNGTARFTFSGSDNAAPAGTLRFACSLDDAAFTFCTSPQTYAGLLDGNHSFGVKASDAAGNVDPSPATYTWRIDMTHPDTAIISFPPNPSNSSNATFAFGSNEVGNSFECRLDSTGFTPCTSPQNITGLANGNHTFQVRAIDAVGNVDPTPASYTWTINTVPPVLGSRNTIQAVRAVLVGLLPAGVSMAETNELSATIDDTAVEAATDQDSSNNTAKQIQAAIRQLDQALASNLWIDDNHLSAKGEKVFERLSDAVKDLLAIKKPPAAVTSAVNTLVSVTHTLAQTALDEAIAAHGKSSKISKAQQEMSKAQQKLAKKQFTDAITHYEKAWEFAQQAVGKNVLATGLNAEEEPESAESRIFLPLITR